MARRGYTRLPDYRLTSELSQHSGRYASPSSSSFSSSVLASRATSSASSSSYTSATTSAGRTLLGTSLSTSLGTSQSTSLGTSQSTSLGTSLSSNLATHDQLDHDDVTESSLSPKPNIRKYGRTTHSQAFSSSSAESRSASRPSTQQRETPSWPAARPLDGRPKAGQAEDAALGKGVHERQTADKLDTESVQTTVWRRRRADSQLESEAQKPEVSSVDEAGSQGRRLESESSEVKLSSHVPDGVDEMSDSDRSLRRLRRQQRLQARDTPQSVLAVSQRAPAADSKTQKGVTTGDTKSQNGVTTGESKRSSCPAEAEVSGADDRQDVIPGAAGVRSSGNTTHLPAQVKIVVVPPHDDTSRQHSDVPLLEELSPVAEKWSGHAGQLATREWTEDDLDEFVRQLSNPQHQVTKRTSREVKDPGRVRGVLTRAATEASPQSHDLDTSFLESDKASRIGDDESKSSGLISGLSGLRLIKNKKMARTSHASAKRSAMLKARQNHHTVSSLLFPDDGDDIDEANSSSGGDGPHVGAPHSCGSSPEGSDGESSGAPAAVDVSKDVKKGRFRKMLTRPLNRSQSAGCAKDVPAHARFLQKQQTTTKEAEWVEALQPRGSEGDIRQARHAEYNEEVDEEELGHDSQPGRVHKTTSADSAMMLVDDMASIAELGVASQPKHKSRNIAKKISRKLFLRRRHTDSALGLVGEGEGARRLATVEPEEVKQWSQSFENLLFDKTGLELFRGFLMTEHSDENIEFWIACQHYKSAKSSKQLPSLAIKIFNDYVAVQSKREINLDSRTRKQTYESVTTNPTRETFDEAQRRVQALMEKDSYRRFLESEIYHDLASGSVQHKS